MHPTRKRKTSRRRAAREREAVPKSTHCPRLQVFQGRDQNRCQHLHNTITQGQEGKEFGSKRKSLPPSLIHKHRKSLTIADLITESESTEKSEQEDPETTSEMNKRTRHSVPAMSTLNSTSTNHRSVMNPSTRICRRNHMHRSHTSCHLPLWPCSELGNLDQGLVLWRSQECVPIHQETPYQASTQTP